MQKRCSPHVSFKETSSKEVTIRFDAGATPQDPFTSHSEKGASTDFALSIGATTASGRCAVPREEATDSSLQKPLRVPLRPL